MKKILALLLAVLMVASLAACGSKDDKKTDSNKQTGSTSNPTAENPEDVTLKVWTSEQDQSSGWLQSRLDAFKAAHPEYNLTFELGVMGEGDAGKQIAADPSAAGDVFMYANDQLGTLLEAGALAKLGGAYLDQVLADNSELLVNTVTYTDGEIYGFPTTNNTWFLYYNKDVYTEEDIKTMDSLLEKGKVAFQMGTAWYTAAFFCGNGGTIFGDKGLDASAGIQFGGSVGEGAAEAMINMATHPNFIDDADGAGVGGMLDGSVSAMFSGSWDYTALYGTDEKPGMGDKLGCAAVPTVTIGGKQVQLKAFAGSKAVGVNPYCKTQKPAMELAAFLASKESQQTRFEMRNVIPCHVELAQDATILANQVAAAEIAVMTNCAAIQPVIPQLGSFWDPMGTFGGNVKNGEINKDNYADQVQILYDRLNPQ